MFFLHILENLTILPATYIIWTVFPASQINVFFRNFFNFNGLSALEFSLSIKFEYMGIFKYSIFSFNELKFQIQNVQRFIKLFRIESLKNVKFPNLSTFQILQDQNIQFVWMNFFKASNILKRD